MDDISKVDLAVDELKKLGKMPLCSQCNESKWSPASDFVSPVIISAKDQEKVIHNRGHPTLLLACNNCGYTRSYLLTFLLDKTKL